MFIICISVLIIAVVVLTNKNNDRKQKIEIESLWPEILEGIISGLIAGISIYETIFEVSKQYSNYRVFKQLHWRLQNQHNLEESLIELKQSLSENICDQVIEILLFSLQFGGNDTIKLFRNLSEAISRDLELRAELLARFGWVKNSALLASISPWVIYLILNLQQNARAAFENQIGRILLIFAAILSVISYLLMKQISKLPSQKRIFLKLNADI